MITIRIDNSYSRLIGLNPDQEKAIKDLLSYTVGSYTSYYSGGFGPQKKSLLSKGGVFPTGLLHRVLLYVVNASIAYEIVDLRVRPSVGPKTSLIGDKELYEAQEKALSAARKSHRGVVSMVTGSGKSLVIASIIAELGVKTLVIVPTLEIKTQLTASLKENVLNKIQYRVENIDNPELKNMNDYECLIIDEAHRVAAKTYHKLNKKAWNSAYFRYFTTATPFRNDDEETLLFEAIAGEVIYKLDYIEAITKGYIVPVESFYVDVPKQNVEGYSWPEVYEELVVNNTMRNAMIATLLQQLYNKSTLCLVKEIDHGNTLSEMTGIQFASGADDSTREYIKEFKEGNIPQLIATEGLLGEGVDTQPCEYVVIAGLGKAKSAFMQKVGRAVRNYPGKETAKVIVFRDVSHKWTKAHFNTQKKILIDEYSSTPVKLKI